MDQGKVVQLGSEPPAIVHDTVKTCEDTHPAICGAPHTLTKSAAFGGAALVCALLIAGGCAGPGPAATGAGVATSGLDAIQHNIFNVRCLSAGCHNGTDQAGNLVLETGVSYANLVNAAPFNAAARAAGLFRVVPGDPAHSFLLIKIIGPGPNEGAGMPLTPPLLSDAEVGLIRDWILAGAPDSSLPTATLAPVRLPTWTSTPVAPPPTSNTPPVAVTTTPTPSWTPIIILTPTIVGTPTVTTQSPTVTSHLTVTPTSTPAPQATATATATATVTSNATLANIQASIFATTCTNPGCHGSVSPGSTLVLVDAATSYANLVNVPAVNIAGSQTGLVRVVPGNPTGSFMFIKLALTAAFDPRYGLRMPSGQAPLSGQQIQLISDWITQGAPP